MSQPRTKAEATKQKKTKTPKRIWSERPSRINSAKAPETRAAKTDKIAKWLVIFFSSSQQALTARRLGLPPNRDIVSIQQNEHVQEPSDYQERVPVLVSHRLHLSRAQL